MIDDHYAEQGVGLSAEVILEQPELLSAVARVTAELLCADHLWLTRLIRLFGFAITVQADMAEVDKRRTRHLATARSETGAP